MAHKIKVTPVPHINLDGSTGTKKEYVVRCNRRGSVCTHEKFSTRRAADQYIAEHWNFVNRRKNTIAKHVQNKREFENRHQGLKYRFYTSPDIQNFQDPRVRAVNISVDVSPAVNALRAAKRQVLTGVHAA